MKVVNISNQAHLIKGGEKNGSFLIERGINKAPKWIAENSYAKRLKAESVLLFDEATITRLQVLKSQADKRNIAYGEYATEEQLEVLLNG